MPKTALVTTYLTDPCEASSIADLLRGEFKRREGATPPIRIAVSKRGNVDVYTNSRRNIETARSVLPEVERVCGI